MGVIGPRAKTSASGSGMGPSDLPIVPASLRPNAATPEEIFGEAWPENDPILQRQLMLELDAWIGGMTRYRLGVDRAKQSKQPLHLSPYRKLLTHWVKPLAEVIDAYRRPYLVKNSGRAGGAPPGWVKRTAHLAAIDMANTALEAIIASAALGKPMKQPALAHSIGKAIEQLHLVQVWSARNPALLRAYREGLSEAGATKKHQEAVLRHGFTSKFLAGLDGDDEANGEETELWSPKEKAEIGLGLIRLAEASTGGRIKLDAESGKRQRKGHRVQSDQLVVMLDEETYGWIERALSRGEVNSTSLHPMLVEPRPWHCPKNGGAPTGGYFLCIGPTNGIVRSGHRSAALVKKRLAEGPSPEIVYEALNYLGRTRWRINRGVLALACEARDAGLNLPGLPNALCRDEPPKPQDIETNKASRLRWRRERARAIEQNIALRGHVLRAAMTLAEAEKFAEEPAIFFPHHCDFRGRIYPMPTTLNIQGPDLARSLLEFADGQPIEDAEAADWLAIHVANCFGQDKAALADRIKWTRDNEPMLRRIARDPLGNRQEWEKEADGLWMALAAAREWVAFLDQGYDFITHLPCFIDGTCNGLQHFAALARDPQLAVLVNLSPSEQPLDIYGSVAKRASTILRQKASKSAPGDTELAQRWRKLLDVGIIPRSVAKSIVMTKPYGVTHKGIMDCVGDLLDALDPQCVVVSEEERPKAHAWLAKIMQEAMTGLLGSADGLMRWLRQVMAVVTRHANSGDGAGPSQGRGFEWTAPTGWPWSMRYGRKDKKIAHVRFNGERSTAAISVESSAMLDAHAQGDAVSPNFVHALDASALVFALDLMQRCGVSGVGVIHDSVGGLATEMSAIGKAVREGFVRLYEEHNPLQNFKEAALAQLQEDRRIGLPEPPEPGKFEVGDVMRSRYFFA